MAKTLNRSEVIGRVGQPPEINRFGDDNMVAKVSIATDESYTKRDGTEVERTEWHDIEFWGGIAGVVEKYVEKGDRLYVSGPTLTDEWEDRDGNTRYSTKIKAQDMLMLGSAGGGSSNMDQRNSTSEEPQPQPEPQREQRAQDGGGNDDTFEPDDSLPF
jgi:single-strand DNA-binding protein